METCRRCVIPLEEKLFPYLPRNSLPIRKDIGLCNSCYELEKDPNFENYPTIFMQEFEHFLTDRTKILFAYSGGLDSTVVLDKLNKECKKKGIELLCFTIDHGFKGVKALDNIKRVIDFEKLNHQMIDITQEEVNFMRVFDFYSDLFRRSVIPCGKDCNEVIDFYYKKILDSLGESVLVTGGDTPKFSPNLIRYSIFWKKSKFTVLRGGIALGLDKRTNRTYILEKDIPWKDPGYGGYDTDCLLPGAILKKLSGSKTLSTDQLTIRLPIILDFFSERVRWGIINKEDALNEMKSLEISDVSSYEEIIKLTKNKNGH